MERCWDCLHFKTKIIRLGNMENNVFDLTKAMQKQLAENDQCRVWYCVKGRLSKEVISTKDYAIKVKNTGCDRREVDNG